MSSRHHRAATTQFVLAVAALLLGGCLTPSLHPLASEADRIFDERLLGTWQESDGSTWTFSHGEDGLYDVDFLSESATLEAGGALTLIDEHYYLDLFGRVPDAQQVFSIPVHQFVGVQIDNDRLRLTLGVGDALASEEVLGAAAAQTMEVNGELMIATATERLRAILALAHANPLFMKRL